MRISYRIWKITLLVFFISALNACSSLPISTPIITPATGLTSTTVPTLTITPSKTPVRQSFNGENAFQDVEKQVAFGPRIPGTQAYADMIEWVKEELSANGWDVQLQETSYQNQPVRNIIAKRGIGIRPWIILGAHYDTRMVADQDPNPDNHEQPVPGGNDGASGVAVLLELARVLPKDINKQVWLVFFDSEDQGNLPGWDWILGSRAFAESLTDHPDAVVIVDMIGDTDLNIKIEKFSSPDLVSEIWNVAAQRGHTQFSPQPGYGMIDDHTPFLQKGIRAIDIIDFDYNYWHTISDTPDKVSPKSLFAVGDTLQFWLEGSN